MGQGWQQGLKVCENSECPSEQVIVIPLFWITARGLQMSLDFGVALESVQHLRPYPSSVYPESSWRAYHAFLSIVTLRVIVDPLYALLPKAVLFCIRQLRHIGIPNNISRPFKSISRPHHPAA